jgi:hypothetical protein
MAAEFQLVKAETLPLTLDLLTNFRSLPPSPVERLKKESRIQHLREKILAGNAITFNWATYELEGKTFRANGMHSSEMLEGLNGEFPAGLTVHMDAYKCDDKQGAVRLFRQFDDRKSMRDPEDVCGAYQMLEDDLVNLNRKTVKRSIEGIAWFDWYVEGVKTLAGDDRYTLAHEKALHPFIAWTDSIFDIKTKELENVVICAAMWATWSKNKDEAMAFWELVAHGGPTGDHAHPTTKLDDWLKDVHQDKLPVKIQKGEIYNGCVFCWNAHRRSDSNFVKIKYDTSKGLFDVLE